MGSSKRFKFAHMFDPPATFGSLDAFGRALHTVAELGFEGAEFSLTYPLGFDPEALSQLAASAPIKITSLLTGWSYLNEGLCLCSADAAIREQAAARLLDHVDTAARIGAFLIVGQMQGFLKDEPNEEIANVRIAECLQRVCRAAEERGVMVVLEPVNHLQVGFNCSVGEVLAMIERVGSPALKPMVDTIHLNIEEKSVTEPIYRLGKDLAHVHLVETNGLMFGTGHLSFPAVFKALADIDYQSYIVVKIYRRSTWEIAARGAMEYLRRLGVVQ